MCVYLVGVVYVKGVDDVITLTDLTDEPSLRTQLHTNTTLSLTQLILEGSHDTLCRLPCNYM